MENVIFSSCLELKKAMESDPRFILLKEKEEKALKDEEVVSLITKKEAILMEYSSILSYKKKDDPEVISIEKKLHQVKLQLDLHPLVKEYNEQYKIVKNIIMEINEQIPNYKRIDVIEILVNGLEKTTTQKIRRYGANVE